MNHRKRDGWGGSNHLLSDSNLTFHRQITAPTLFREKKLSCERKLLGIRQVERLHRPVR